MARAHTQIRMARHLDQTRTKMDIQTPMTGPRIRMRERELIRMEGRHPIPTAERQGRITRIRTDGAALSPTVVFPAAVAEQK